ncbi:LysR family transcriptional regulator [Leucobacter sp. USHLN153]|uniref:LysR family transcriptional regulator n=1 Tax=Leucobacter sp. USHLN153 TaxID=3081268 RepID=UPI0030178D2C
MDFVHLETFMAVVEHGSITAAANYLLRAPSNVSTRIKQLETSLGLTLFVRESRSTRLSDDGERFLEYAQQILQLAEDAKSLTATSKPSGPLRIGALESTAVVRVPQILAEFHVAYPEVRLAITAADSSSLVEGVRAGQYAAVFTDGKPTLPELTGIPAFREDLVIISPLSLETLSPSDPPAAAYVFGSACSYRHRFESWFEASHVRPKRIVELASYHSMVACAAAGAGISMIPASLLHQVPGARGVRVHELTPDLGRATTWLTWRRDSGSAALRAFVEHVQHSLERQQDSGPAVLQQAPPVAESAF